MWCRIVTRYRDGWDRGFPPHMHGFSQSVDSMRPAFKVRLSRFARAGKPAWMAPLKLLFLGNPSPGSWPPTDNNKNQNLILTLLSRALALSHLPFLPGLFLATLSKAIV